MCDSNYTLTVCFSFYKALFVSFCLVGEFGVRGRLLLSIAVGKLL